MRKIGQIIILLIPFVAFSALVVFIAGCERQKTAKIEENKAIVRRYFAEIDKKNWAIFDELLAPNYVCYFQGSPKPLTRDAIEQGTRNLYSAFPDLNHTIEDLIAEGDKVMLRVTDHGTHLGDFRGIPPTGKKVTFGAIAIFRIKESKIVEFWGEYDLFGLMQQLGAVPPLGEG